MNVVNKRAGRIIAVNMLNRGGKARLAPKVLHYDEYEGARVNVVGKTRTKGRITVADTRTYSERVSDLYRNKAYRTKSALVMKNDDHKKMRAKISWHEKRYRNNAYPQLTRNVYLINEKGKRFVPRAGYMNFRRFRLLYSLITVLPDPSGERNIPPGWMYNRVEGRWEYSDPFSMEDRMTRFFLESEVVTLHYTVPTKKGLAEIVGKGKGARKRRMEQGHARTLYKMEYEDIEKFMKKQSFAIPRIGTDQCIITPAIRDLESMLEKKYNKDIAGVLKIMKRKKLENKVGGWTKEELEKELQRCDKGTRGGIPCKFVIHDILGRGKIDICGKANSKGKYRITFHYYNVMKNHVEYIGRGSELEMKKRVCVKNDEFRSALKKSLESGNVNRIFLNRDCIVDTQNLDIYTFSVNNLRYYREEDKEDMAKMDELMKAKGDISSLGMVTYGTVMYDAIRKASVNQPPRIIMEKKYRYLDNEVYETDMTKCYLQYRKCEYYRGFCRVPNMYLDKPKNHDMPGFYNIAIYPDQETNKFLDVKLFSSGWYCEPYLSYFDDNNIRYEMRCAYVSGQKTLDIDIAQYFSENNKLYAIMVGMLGSDKMNAKLVMVKNIEDCPFPFTDSIDVNFDGVPCKLLTVRNQGIFEYGQNSRHISAYIYCYAMLNILKRLSMVPRSDIIGMYVDAVLTKKKIELPDCKPPKEFPAEKLPTKSDAKFFKDDVMYTQYDTSVNVNEILLDYDDDEYMIPNTMFNVFRGRGGTGKSSLIDRCGYGSYYCTVSHDLLKAMKSKGFITEVFDPIRMENRRLTSAFLNKHPEYIDRMHMLTLDELTLFNMDIFKTIIDRAFESNVRVNICLDEGQLETEPGLCEKMIEYIKSKTNDISYIETKTDYRSKDNKIRDLKIKLHELALKKASCKEVNVELLKFLKLSKLTEDDLKNEKTIVMTLQGKKTLPDIYGDIYVEERHSSVHAMQGKTIEDGWTGKFQVFPILSGYWASIYAQYIYTAVSRCRRITQLSPFMSDMKSFSS